MVTSVSKEYTASVFSGNVKMKAVYSYGMLATINQTVQDTSQKTAVSVYI
jgi:hypothetical protein